MRLPARDVAAALGFDEAESPLDVYARLIYGTETKPSKLEPYRDILLRAHVERSGAELFAVTADIEHATAALSCLPDALTGDDRAPISAILFAAQRPGEHWNPGIPKRVLIHAQVAMACVGCRFADVITIATDLDIAIYRIPFDAAVSEQLVAAADEWARVCLDGRNPPQATGSDALREIMSRYPEVTEDRWIQDSSEDTIEACRALRAAKVELMMSQTRHDIAMTSVLVRIAGAPGIRTPECVVTWEMSRKGRRRAVLTWYPSPGDPSERRPRRLTKLYKDRDHVLREMHDLLRAVDPAEQERIIREIIVPAVSAAHVDSMMQLPDANFYALADEIRASHPELIASP